MKLRVLAPAAVALTAGALLIGGCGSGSSGSAAAGTTTGAGTATTGHEGHTTTGYLGGVISPAQAAPPLRLKDINGKTVDIRDFTGHPTLVTFVYSHCPDVCPLIMSNLRVVRKDSPIGSKLRVVAVSVDPKGDTPTAVRAFLARQRVGAFVHYLIGSRPELEKTWNAWGVAATVPKSDPEAVEHSAYIFGITASGKRATLYPVGFSPDDIVKDLPKLASS